MVNELLRQSKSSQYILLNRASSGAFSLPKFSETKLFNSITVIRKNIKLILFSFDKYYKFPEGYYEGM